MTGLGRIRAKTIASYRQIERALLDRKLLPPEEAANLHFEIVWLIEDQRSGPSKVDLPQWPYTETISP